MHGYMNVKKNSKCNFERALTLQAY